jgi:hypothetical protein
VGSPAYRAGRRGVPQNPADLARHGARVCRTVQGDSGFIAWLQGQIGEAWWSDAD